MKAVDKYNEMNHKNIMLSKQKFRFIYHSRKDKTAEQNSDQWLPKAEGKGREVIIKGYEETFGVYKVF